jgi:putative Mg2+ transporter-C (MgtC) family protein
MNRELPIRLGGRQRNATNSNHSIGHIRHFFTSVFFAKKAIMDTLEIALRLGTAALVGTMLGLNRDLHGKPTGVRTLGMVGIGSALVVLAFGQVNDADASRVAQGIVTGIGFLGAGVIIRNNEDSHIHGLTTATCVWLTACIGAACGISEWRIILLSLPFVLVLLIFGGTFEKAIHRRWPQSTKSEAD